MRNKLSWFNKIGVLFLAVFASIQGIYVVLEIISFFNNTSNITIDIIVKAIPDSSILLIFIINIVCIFYCSVQENKINKLLKDDLLKNGEQSINITARVKYKNGSIVDIFFSKKEDLKGD